jgi:hypothetical protein
MLPTGSVVLIDGLDFPILIIGLCQVRLEEETPTRVFDYAGVSAVTGLTTPDEMIRFDREAILRVLHIGCLSEEIEAYLEKADKAMQGLRDGSLTIEELMSGEE